MKIGLIGSGGREHAMALALMRNPQRDRLFVYASHINPGIAAVTGEVRMGKMDDVASILAYFNSVQPDLIVIGPEAPLIAGAVDQLRQAGFPTLGPTRAQSQLEGDKSFMRDLLKRRVGYGSPAWQVVTSAEDARSFIEKVGEVAVKPLGLTGGKGVRVMGVHLHSLQEAVDDAAHWIARDGSVLLEERLVGEEFSRIVLTSDGKTAPMPVAQDFKYAYDGDQGNMTGGMGAYTMADGSMPFLTAEDLNKADRLMQDVIEALSEETGEPYRGFLYGQFMVTRKGIYIIEFNVRLGDPEGINEMTLVDCDLPQVFLAAAQGELAPEALRFAARSSVCKYLVPADYPDNSPNPQYFDLDQNAVEQAGFSLSPASVAQEGGRWKTLGSRTMAVIGLGEAPGEVSAKIETLLAQVQPPELRHRKDVGDELIVQQKVERMAKIRAGENL